MTNKWKELTVLGLILTIVISITPQMALADSLDSLLFSDDFDNYTIGSFPSQWTLVFNGMGDQYQQVVSDPVNSANNCFQLQGERNWAADAVKYFQSDSDVIGFEASVLVTENNGASEDDVKMGLWKQVNWGQAKWNDGIIFTDNGTIVARPYVDVEGSGTVLQTYVPGQWYHIRFILDRPNQLISVYIDGVLKGESIKGSNLPYVFDGFAISGRYSEIPVNYDNVKIFEASPSNVDQEPTLAASCTSSASLSNFNVQITGDLSFNGSGISEAPILLSYSVTGGKSWIDLTLVQTDTEGNYYAEWKPSVTGYYSLKAVYEGNENYAETSTIVNFAVEPFQEQSVFTVNSNSTITEFFFNSNISELSFGVSGDSGTTGYVNVNIPKSLVRDISNLKVYLDNNQIEYSYKAQEDGWLLYFTYNHSTHLVAISLSSSNTQILSLGLVETAILVFMGILVAITIFAVYVVLRKRDIKENSGA